MGRVHNSFPCTEFLVATSRRSSWGWRWRVWGEAKQRPGGAGRAAVRVLWLSVLLLPCCWHRGLLPGQGRRMESTQGKGAARGGSASVVSHGFTPGRLRCHPLEKSSVRGHLSQASSATSPVFSAVPCASTAGVTQVPGGSSIEGLLLLPVL